MGLERTLNGLNPCFICNKAVFNSMVSLTTFEVGMAHRTKIKIYMNKNI